MAINRDNPYEARRRPRAYKGLRSPHSPEEPKISRHPAGIGDVKDAYLRGQGSSPYSAAHLTKKK